MPNPKSDHVANSLATEAVRITTRLSTTLYDFYPNISDTKLMKIERGFKKIIREELMEAKRE